MGKRLLERMGELCVMGWVSGYSFQTLAGNFRYSGLRCFVQGFGQFIFDQGWLLAVQVRHPSYQQPQMRQRNAATH